MTTPHAARTLSIAAVERETGLSKDTLRVWERRYGFPAPMRDAFGERAYPVDQVERLRVIRRLLDGGHRAGGVVPLPLIQLHRLAEAVDEEVGGRTVSTAARPAPDVGPYVARVKAHDPRSLREALDDAQRRLGLARFVTDVAAPLCRAVGDCWARGTVEVYEEHLTTDAVRTVLRNGIDAAATADGRPRVLLATLPGESHALGLLMAEAMFSLEGCRCVNVGVQTPIWDVVMASSAHRVDIVALSFSGAVNANFIRDGLAELRSVLPREVELWAGGSAAVLQRRPPADVVVEIDLARIGARVAGWRSAHPSG